MSATLHLSLLALAWAGYALIHSLLAAESTKLLFRKNFPEGFRGYRLAYNLVAVCLLVPPLWLLASYPGTPLWHWPGMLRWLADGTALLALVALLLSGGLYDVREFLGLTQLRTPRAALDDLAPLRITTLHRFVRHPWYCFGLVIIWTREMNAALLVTAICLTLYLLGGSRLEERKLLSRYGRRYARYRARVPGLLPRPWKYLSKQEAERILAGNTDD